MTGSVKLNTLSSGSVTLSPADTASNVTVTIPAATDTLVNLGSTQTLTNKTLTAAGSNSVEATSGPTSTQLAGQRNKIINGAMMIDQRNAGAAVTNIIGSVFPVDRFVLTGSAASKCTGQQNAGAVVPPAGFTNYLGVTSLSAYTVAASDYFAVAQTIEGYNFADFGFGTANAKTVTISFWAYSSLTGTFGGSLQNYAENRCYSFSYSIPVANTWTYITVTIPGDTGGTWVGASNAGAAWVWFGLGAGSTRTGTAGSWGGQNLQPTGTVSVVGTNGATFYITGVQLEKGATATPFENRLYGTELALCQRYYQKSYDTNSSVPTVNTVSGAIGGYKDRTSDTSFLSVRFKTEMRATPTVTTYDYQGNAGKMAGGSNASLSATVYQQGTSGFNVVSGTGNPGVDSYVNYAASIEL